ncbi:MAG: hypothetical protein MUQ00_16680 [Candidatus Aminicenantes bacterium]|nr:hypothetical protein [Candidatus Aminicenantes bacterium]
MDNEENIENEFNEALHALELFKEVERFRFDYYKQLSILSTGSIGAILAFIIKLLPTSNCIILAILSLIFLFLCLIFSLFGMTAPSNMIVYLIGIRTIATSKQKSPEERKKDKKEYEDKYSRGLKEIKVVDWVCKIVFIQGIFLFLLFAASNMAGSK